MNYSMRYVLDLGPVDLEHIGVQTFRLAELPNAEFNVGFEIVESVPNALNGPRPDHRGKLRLALMSSDGQVIFRREDSLDQWVWSHGAGDSKSRLYLRGESKDVPIGGGDTKGVRLGEGPSGGWGTYFDSRESESYSLKLEVLEPLAVPGRAVRCVVVGWDKA